LRKPRPATQAMCIGPRPKRLRIKVNLICLFAAMSLSHNFFDTLAAFGGHRLGIRHLF